MERTHYPEYEVRLPWLSPLLDTYHLVDEAVRQDLASRSDKIPCGPGCVSCCTGGIVPLNSVEASGIVWYVTSQLREGIREKVMSQIRRFEPGQDRCPFLMERGCGIYKVRPVSCRTFHVIGRKCRPDMNITGIREKDIYYTPKEKMAAAVQPLGTAFEMIGRNEQGRTFDDSFHLKMIRPLRDLDWCVMTLPGMDMRYVWYR